MSWTPLVNHKKPVSKSIVKGARLRWVAARVRDDWHEYVMLTIGAVASERLGLSGAECKVSVLFGDGEEQGRLAVVLSQKGTFEARRRKTGEYNITFSTVSVEGKLRPKFDTLSCTELKIERLKQSDPAFGIMDISAALEVGL